MHGDTSLRCGISLKGGEIVVRGSVGGNSMFMAQAGALVVCGDAGEALGDSLYEARIYVRGSVAGARGGLRREGDARRARAQVGATCWNAPASARTSTLGQFRRYGSARQLYTFKIDNAGAY